MRAVAIIATLIVFLSVFTYAFATPVTVSTVRVRALQGYLIDVFFENAGGSSCGTPTPNTAEAYPTSSGFFSLTNQCLTSPQFTTSTSFAGGNCVFLLYAASFLFASTISITLYVANAAGTNINTIGTSTIPIPGSLNLNPQQYISLFTCKSFTISAGDYLVLSLQMSGGFFVIVYYGSTTPTDFQLVRSVATA